jgi:hypothetical protein
MLFMATTAAAAPAFIAVTLRFVLALRFVFAPGLVFALRSVLAL